MEAIYSRCDSDSRDQTRQQARTEVTWSGELGRSRKKRCVAPKNVSFLDILWGFLFFNLVEQVANSLLPISQLKLRGLSGRSFGFKIQFTDDCIIFSLPLVVLTVSLFASPHTFVKTSSSPPRPSDTHSNTAKHQLHTLPLADSDITCAKCRVRLRLALSDSWCPLVSTEDTAVLLKSTAVVSRLLISLWHV